MTCRALAATLAAILLAGLATPPASHAAFPGRNGDLVVAPSDGDGIELVAPDGHRARRICTDETLCGRPDRPRFSPNGRGIVFGTGIGGQIGVVAPDGVCLWCRLSPLRAGGTGPSFASDVAVIASSPSGGRPHRIPLTGGRARPIAPAGAGDVAVSSQGQLAVVRDGAIELTWPDDGDAVRVTGTEPDWSPAGTALAFTRAGAVWTISSRPGARGRRIAAGSSPAWSPDGRRIAFVAPDGEVATISPGGGSARPVGTITGSSVDWGPATGPDPCTGLRGRTVLATADSVVRERSVSYGDGELYLGSRDDACLRLTGHSVRVFESGPGGDCHGGAALSALRLAGRFVASQVFTCDYTDGSCSTGVGAVDLGAGRDLAAGGTDPADESCELSDLRLDSSGFLAWSEGPSCTGSGTGTDACTRATLFASDHAGTRPVDAGPPGDPLPFSGVTLSGNATTLSWLDAGALHTLALR